ncbi:HAD family hydrolase [Desulfovibrio aminophilus]|uniref:HAD family hydrolase n=1 Tax=Desulfovibrio aminophilus TaxID=81425 RepID=UPI00041AC589|nr:HAD family hydrolase [Desulfovibrio aminophilus]
MPIDAVIFDFDGTLAELVIDFNRMRTAIAALAEAFLGERPESGGLPVLEWLEELVEEVEAFDEDLGKQLRTRGLLTITAMELDAAARGKLFGFARPVLSGLAARGLATGIITRNCTAAVKKVFPDVEKSCGVFLAREDAPRVKPDPAHALLALERLGVEPGRTLLVGDHPLDVETARRAGMLAGAVASGRVGLEELSLAAPDFVAENCALLLTQLGLLDGLGNGIALGKESR